MRLALSFRGLPSRQPGNADTGLRPRIGCVTTRRGEYPWPRRLTGERTSMPSTTEDLYSTSAMYGASTGRPRRRKTTSFASTALPNTASGIWESTTKSPQPKRHQAEQQTQKQTCQQREIECHVSPLDRDVAGSRPNPIWL